MRDTSLQILSYDRKRSLPLEGESTNLNSQVSVVYGFEGVNVEIFCIPAVPHAKSVLHTFIFCGSIRLQKMLVY